MKYITTSGRQYRNFDAAAAVPPVVHGCLPYHVDLATLFEIMKQQVMMKLQILIYAWLRKRHFNCSKFSDFLVN